MATDPSLPHLDGEDRLDMATLGAVIVPLVFIFTLSLGDFSEELPTLRDGILLPPGQGILAPLAPDPPLTHSSGFGILLIAALPAFRGLAVLVAGAARAQL